MKDPKKQIPIREGLFTWPASEPRIIASKCNTCGSVAFPKIGTCRDPNCSSETGVEEITLSRTGKLDGYTIMEYQPPEPWPGPESMVPFGQGFVLMPEGVSICSVLASADPDELKVGRDMELVIFKLYEDEDGNEVMSYKFKPV